MNTSGPYSSRVVDITNNSFFSKFDKSIFLLPHYCEVPTLSVMKTTLQLIRAPRATQGEARDRPKRPASPPHRRLTDAPTGPDRAARPRASEPQEPPEPTPRAPGMSGAVWLGQTLAAEIATRCQGRSAADLLEEDDAVLYW